MTYADSHCCARTGPCDQRDLDFFAAKCGVSISLLVAPLRRMHVFESQRFFIQDRRPSGSGIFPGGNVRKVCVVAKCLAIRCLVLLSEVTTAGFVATECVEAH